MPPVRVGNAVEEYAPEGRPRVRRAAVPLVTALARRSPVGTQVGLGNGKVGYLGNGHWSEPRPLDLDLS
jgi:hypothetical protein